MGSNGSNGHSKSLVFVQLTGGNDALNTVVPINDEHLPQFPPNGAVSVRRAVGS